MPTPMLTGFTTKQLELIFATLCNLELEPTQPEYAHLIKIRKKIALKLARLYYLDTRIGEDPGKAHPSYKHWLKRKHGIVQSREKAEKYAKLAGIELPPMNTEQFNEEDAQGYAILNKLKSSLSWFTSIRLFIIRAHRVYSLYAKPFLTRVFPFFPILSLSYVFEAILGSAEILKAPQKPLSDHEIGMPGWRRNLQRIYNSIFNVPTLSYLGNAIVWFPINLLSIKFTAGLFFVISNLAGFSFDVVNEAFKGSDTLWHGIRGIFKIAKLSKNPNMDPEKAQAWQLINSALKKEMRRTFRQTAYSTFMTTVILVGMGLIFVPHTMPVGVGLMAGAILALSGGSVFLGFGKRVAMATLDFVTSLLGTSVTPRNELDLKQKLSAQKHPASIRGTHAQLNKTLAQPAKRRKTINVDGKTILRKIPTFPKTNRWTEAQLAAARQILARQKSTTPIYQCTKDDLKPRIRTR